MRGLRAGPLAARALARDTSGTVASTHSRALNLLLEDGWVVAVLPAGSPLHPWALATAFDPSLVREGELVRVSANVLAAGSLRIDLDGLVIVELRLRQRPAQLPAEAGSGLVQLSGAPLGDDPFDRMLARALGGFAETGDPRELASLVGLGGGLTPSGDDVLVGALAGLDLLSNCGPSARPLRRAILDALPVPLEYRTTRLSAQMLRAAAKSLYAEPVLAVLGALARKDANLASVECAVEELLHVGHRSGRDTLLGIAAAFSRTISRACSAAGLWSPLPGGEG